MSPLLFLLLAVALSAAGGALLWLRHRPPSSHDAGIKAFRRGMEALSPQRTSPPRGRRRGR